jgi:hypothetical protein
MDWTPVVEPRVVAGATVQTIRAAATNVAGHDVTVDGRTLRVLPEDVTTSRKRSCIISEALAAVDGMQLDPLAYVAGRLLFEGASNLWLDQHPLTPQPGEATVEWVVTLAGDGTVNARFVGGTTR